MAITADIVDELTSCVGAEESRRLGCVTELMISRYAEAIGQLDDPLYSDREVARQQGYAAIPAPLNLVPSIIGWAFGLEALRQSEKGADVIPLTHVSTDGLLVMGGGEEMVFTAPVLAGMWIHERSSLVEVTSKTGRSGLTAVLRYRNQFDDENGSPLMTCIRTLLVR